MMDFYRRPVLAGNNVQRTQYATLHGSIRRSDPTGGHPVPWFTGVSATQTLIVQTQGPITSTITLTGNTLLGIINDVNTQFVSDGAGAVAFDSDGCLGLRSTAPGTAGFVTVTGGTASAGLGFDTALQTFSAYGAEIPDSPFGAVGNPRGTAFPTKGEGFSQAAYLRGLAQLSGNADVLHADMVRPDAHLKKLMSFSGPSAAISGSTTSGSIALSPSTSRVFTGLGLLSRTSGVSDLAPFFQLIDSVTKLPSQYQVVAVTRGAVTGNAPYTDASATWSSGIGNVLGLQQNKTSALTISAIYNGRVVECSAATFVTSGVQPGDWATIASATNTDQGNNNGAKWLVEQVISETRIVLRPLSRTELQQAGVTLPEVRPILELSSFTSGGQVLGTIQVTTGTYNSGISLVVMPPIPSGANLDVWVASDFGGVRGAKTYDFLESLYSLFTNNVAPSGIVNAPSVNGFITAPWATWDSNPSGNISLTESHFRLNGKYVRIPAATFAAANLANGFAAGTHTVYFVADLHTGVLKTLDSDATTLRPAPNDPSSPTTPAESAIVATATCTADGIGGVTITALVNAGRQLGEGAREVTVGVGGQFLRLVDAINYANAIGFNDSASLGPNGAWPHFDIVLVSNTVVQSTDVINLFVPSVRIRGSNPDISLTWNSTQPFRILYGAASTIILEDFKIVNSGGLQSSAFFKVENGTARFIVRNIQQSSSGGASTTVNTMFNTNSGGGIDTISISDSSFQWGQYLIGANGPGNSSAGCSKIFLRNSKFDCNTPGGTLTTLVTNLSATGWSGKLLVISGCEFTNLFTTSTTAMISKIVTGAGRVAIRDSTFDVKTGYTGAGGNTAAILIDSDGSELPVLFDGNTIGGSFPVPRAINGGIGAVVSNNFITAFPTGGSVITCRAAIGNRVVLNNSSSASGTAITVVDGGSASDNTISGNGSGILAAGSATIAGNQISLSDGGTTLATYGISGGSGLLITGNRVVLSAGTNHSQNVVAVTNDGGGLPTIISNNFLNGNIAGSDCLDLNPATGCQVTISSNSLLVPNLASCSAIHAGATLTNAIICDNLFSITVGAPAALIFAGGSASFHGNRVIASVGQEVFSLSGTPNLHVVGNYFLADVLTSPASTSGEFKNNYVAGDYTATHASDASYTGNRFARNVTMTLNSVRVGLDGNYVLGTFVVSDATGELLATGNEFVGAATFPAAVGAKFHFDSNRFMSSVTGFGSGLFKSNYVASTFASAIDAALVLYAAGNYFNAAVTISDNTHQPTAYSTFADNWFASTITTYNKKIIFTGNYSASGITLGKVIEAKISGNWLFSISGLTAGDAATVSTISIHDNYCGTVSMTSSVGDAAMINYINVVSNTLETTSGTVTYDASGATAASAHHVAVSSNIVVCSTAGGIYLLGAAAVSLFTSVNNNIVHGKSNHGMIQCNYATGTINGNTIRDGNDASSGGASISISNCAGFSILGNATTSLDPSGLLYSYASIYVSGSSGVQVVGNRGLATNYGLYVASCTDLTVVGNTFEVLQSENLANPSNHTVLYFSTTHRVHVDRNTLRKTNGGALAVTFIYVASDANGIIFGSNIFSGVASGVITDLNSGTGIDDTWYTANLSTTNPGSSASGNYAGGIRE